MKKFLELGNRYAAKSDWKDLKSLLYRKRNDRGAEVKSQAAIIAA